MLGQDARTLRLVLARAMRNLVTVARGGSLVAPECQICCNTRGVRTCAARNRLRFLIKCDDDAFLDIDAVAADIMASAPVGQLWSCMRSLQPHFHRMQAIAKLWIREDAPCNMLELPPAAGLLWGHVPQMVSAF